MRNVAVVLSLIATCAVLAACGDSDADSSSTKTTATAPTAEAGGTAAKACTPPAYSGVTFTSFDAVNVDCAEATTAYRAVYEKGAVTGWTCQPSIVGRDHSYECAKDADATQTFSAAWQE